MPEHGPSSADAKLEVQRGDAGLAARSNNQTKTTNHNHTNNNQAGAVTSPPQIFQLLHWNSYTLHAMQHQYIFRSDGTSTGGQLHGRKGLPGLSSALRVARLPSCPANGSTSWWWKLPILTRRSSWFRPHCEALRRLAVFQPHAQKILQSGKACHE
jgi:hypothetical protein